MVVRKHRWAKPTWFTKLCRAAHRAGANWTALCEEDPLKMKSFEALRRLRYVQTANDKLNTILCTSKVDVDRVRRGVAAQIIVDTVTATAGISSDKWVNGLNQEEGVSKKASRDREDHEAIGGSDDRAIG